MKQSKAPAGMVTWVKVVIAMSPTPDTFQRRTYEWTTPLALYVAYHQAPKWALVELRREKVKGRSKVHRIDVTVEYQPGIYEKDRASV